MGGKDRDVFILLGLVVPYSVDARSRKESQGRKINSQKGLTDKAKTATTSINEERQAFWNENFFLYASPSPPLGLTSHNDVQ